LKALSTSCSDFWQLWELHRDYFYQRCLQWLGSNSHDAEDVMSQVMLQAWNKWSKYATQIKYPKAWLTRMIYNFCMDIHRKRQREITEIENIQDLKFEDCSALYSRINCPASNLLDLEMRAYIRHKIKSLPARLRQTFVLHYCQEISYPDIAKQLVCSEDNIRKSVRKARRILQRHLKRYLAGEDDTALDSHSPSLKLITPIAEKSQPDEESPIVTNSNREEINYQVTVICLETLPHLWYSSPSSLGWR
jgi:RNA polymerase sigma-70 factor (ECF subfamily)